MSFATGQGHNIFVNQGGLEPAQPNRFVVRILRPPGQLGQPPDAFEVTVRRFDAGSKEINTNTIEMLNRVIQYPVGLNFTQADLRLGVFTGSSGGKQVFEWFQKWMDLVYNPETGQVGILSDGGGDLAVNGDLEVTVYGADSELKVATVTIKDCYPRTMRLVDLDCEREDILTVEINLVVHEWSIREG